MKKNLMALAVAGTLVAPAMAFAQASTVQIYGQMDGSFESVSASGASLNTAGAQTDYASRGRIASNSSYLGFKGTENLGGGLRAIWQLENQLSIDGVGGNNTQTMANGWNTRTTFVGLTGGFGQVLVGYLNPPRRALRSATGLTPGGTSVTSASNIFGRLNLGAALNPYNTATGRTGNTFGSAATGLNNSVSTESRDQGVSYTTHNLNGFTAEIFYNPKESSDNAPVGAGLAKRSPNLWDLGLNYTSGPLILKATYTKYNDWAVKSVSSANLGTLGLSGSEDTKLLRLMAGYTFGGQTSVAFAYDRTDMSLGQSGGFAALGDLNVRRDVWAIRARHFMGPHEIFAGYARIGDNSVSGRTLAANQTFGESGADWYGLRYGYNFSKRTQIYAHYVEIRNKANGNLDTSVNGMLPGGTGGGAGVISAGADPRVIGIGVRTTY